MISIYDLSLDFDENFNLGQSSTIGKISDSDIAVCFYNSKRVSMMSKAVGGAKNSSYGIKAVTVLLRYTNDALKAETMALAIKDYFDERKAVINGKKARYQLVYNEPVFLGTDDTGIYEYSFELNIIYER